MFFELENRSLIGEEKWEKYGGCFSKMDIPTKTTLLKEGEISTKFFFIEKGCVRAHFNNDGKDVTFQFFFENETLASIESFKKNIPSNISFQTIEPSIIWEASKTDVDNIISEITEIPLLKNQFIDAIFDRTFNYMAHFLSFIKETPEERYQNLIKEKPEIVKRIPQHYIASYLGISSVHLSRIKNHLLKGKH